jgi:hypothetical protein
MKRFPTLSSSYIAKKTAILLLLAFVLFRPSLLDDGLKSAGLQLHRLESMSKAISVSLSAHLNQWIPY